MIAGAEQYTAVDKVLQEGDESRVDRPPSHADAEPCRHKRLLPRPSAVKGLTLFTEKAIQHRLDRLVAHECAKRSTLPYTHPSVASEDLSPKTVRVK